MTFMRQLDLLLLAAALPIFLIGGLPMAGWGAAAGAWLAQRALQAYLLRRARAAEDPRTTVGLMAGSMIARGWMVAIVIFLVGLSDNHAGLAAAVLVIALFTVYFTMNMILGPLDAPASSAAGRTGPGGRTPRPPLAPNGGAR
jgi:hypothetical protein